MQTNGPYGKLVAAGSHHSIHLCWSRGPSSVSKSLFLFPPVTSGLWLFATISNWKQQLESRKKEEFPSPITPGRCVHSISSGGGAGVGIALIYLWHFHCELCSGHGRSGLQQRRLSTNSSRKMYLYFIHVHNIHSIPFQASARGHLKQRTIPLASATHYYAFALAMAMAKSSLPFNTQESVTQQISHSFHLGQFSRCALQFSSRNLYSYIFLASSVIIEPRNSLCFTYDWNSSKLNRVYINCAVNVPNRRKKLSFDATLRTCGWRKRDSCDRFECVCVSIVFQLRVGGAHNLFTENMPEIGRYSKYVLP